MDDYERKQYDEQAQRAGVKEQELKTSEEGVQSLHTVYRHGRIDCQVKIPTFKVRHKVNGRTQETRFTKVGGIFAPLSAMKGKDG